jgi:hypothetical protein
LNNNWRTSQLRQSKIDIRATIHCENGDRRKRTTTPGQRKSNGRFEKRKEPKPASRLVYKASTPAVSTGSPRASAPAKTRSPAVTKTGTLLLDEPYIDERSEDSVGSGGEGISRSSDRSREDFRSVTEENFVWSRKKRDLSARA